VDRQASDVTAHLDVAYIHPTDLRSYLSMPGINPMAIISFGYEFSDTFPCTAIALNLPQLSDPPLIEIWHSNQPVSTRKETTCSLTTSGHLLLGSIQLAEEPGVPLDLTTYTAYREVLLRIRESGYPYLWRAWNYFPHINDEQEGLERYRRFCVGRHRALSELLPDFPTSIPAATAVGTKSGPLQIVFLAGIQSATHLGNPRQWNAYDYPREYGPCSPSFARATFSDSEHQALLFIAGTASIVGHTSYHAGLPDEQAKETIRNLHAILSHTDYALKVKRLNAPTRARYKIYVRNPELLQDVRQVFQDSPLSELPALFLQSDLCRKELLVEIEGLLITS